jgi:hypothetical protein
VLALIAALHTLTIFAHLAATVLASFALALSWRFFLVALLGWRFVTLLGERILFLAALRCNCRFFHHSVPSTIVDNLHPNQI